MERSEFGDSGAESGSDRDPGFDSQAKQSVGSNSFTDMDNGGGGGEAGATAQSSNGTVDDEDDGFRTPTSVDRKIKMIQTCPPAPRKPPPPPPSRKRKALFPVDQTAVLAELSAEVAKLSAGKKARVLAVPAKVI
uniref:Uncharacterized protein n=1 Tax=Kalanchoe fedtschenkoi TaxID=63787 RepID=A0A7N0UJ55_KALFE